MTSSVSDYAVPTATAIPYLDLTRSETPSPRNPLGMKGVGEAGTVSATPAVVNAVLDALRPEGVLNLDLPMTPDRIWRALHEEPCA